MSMNPATGKPISGGLWCRVGKNMRFYNERLLNKKGWLGV
jgi:hypothetical protein